jgi:pimeloyl-ACP methyl ester carboxylesterase
VIASLPGARIWYEDTVASGPPRGGGVPVVFMHAGSGSSRLWSFQFPAFTLSGYRCIAYDRRGHGRSVVEEPADAPPATAADDLLALMDKLRIERCHLVGTAAGGIAAFDFALSFPQRLGSLVIANSIGGVQDQEYLKLQRRLRPSPQFDALPAEIRELGPVYRAANPEGVRQWVELEQASRAPGTPTLPKTRTRITFASLETLRVPTLLLTGDADLYAPPPVMKLFTDRIKHAQSAVIPECGHSAFWEQPEHFNKAVLDFLNRGQAPI